MIKHIVMFQIKESHEGADKSFLLQQAARQLDHFQTAIPSLKKFAYAMNSPLAPTDNYDILLECTFEDMQGLNDYVVHPVHQEFGKFIVAIKENRACIDYEI
ncbi:MAG: Dabb family protein [Lachnospiraceae bacterium]